MENRGRLVPLLAAGAMCAMLGCAEPSPEQQTENLDWDPLSLGMGNPPNFAQLGNGSVMTVVSRDYGRGSKAGALVELFYPHYAADNLWDSYVGVRVGDGDHHWAHEISLLEQRVRSDTGLVQSDFAGPGYQLRIEDVLRPGHDAHLRRVTITNVSPRTLPSVDLSFYAFYTVGDLPGGDEIWLADDGRTLLQQDDGTTIATGADLPPTATHCGHANRSWGKERDARKAVEQGKMSGCVHADTAVSGVNVALGHELGDIAPGGVRQVTYAIGLGADEASAREELDGALEAGFEGGAEEDAARWADVLGRAKIPASLPNDARAVYRRAVITMHQHRVDNGGFIAAGTLTSPVYRFVWPRDGAKTATDMLALGFTEEAADFFAFLETLQLDDGSFAVNYFPDGSRPLWDFGTHGNEHDQPGMLPWGVEKVWRVSGDRDWLEARWDGVQRAADHLVDMHDPRTGLLSRSRDLWELETGGSWTYANASAVAGLEASARIATELGHTADATRWQGQADGLRAAMHERLITDAGYWGRGYKKGRLDERLEVANLALGAGGFEIVDDTSAPMARLGDEVWARLGTPGGGVRRYEGDKYYGGQPWPVAAVWLGLHRVARGQRGEAEALFDVMTQQAYATGALTLGEQFDETRQRWLSATALVWSEAAYIRLALALYE